MCNSGSTLEIPNFHKLTTLPHTRSRILFTAHQATQQSTANIYNQASLLPATLKCQIDCMESMILHNVRMRCWVIACPLNMACVLPYIADFFPWVSIRTALHLVVIPTIACFVCGSLLCWSGLFVSFSCLWLLVSPRINSF